MGRPELGECDFRGVTIRNITFVNMNVPDYKSSENPLLPTVPVRKRIFIPHVSRECDGVERAGLTRANYQSGGGDRS